MDFIVLYIGFFAQFLYIHFESVFSTLAVSEAIPLPVIYIYVRNVACLPNRKTAEAFVTPEKPLKTVIRPPHALPPAIHILPVCASARTRMLMPVPPIGSPRYLMVWLGVLEY